MKNILLNFYNITLDFLYEHRQALFVMILVGFIAGFPQVIARKALGPSYQGIPYLIHDSEAEYMNRIQDIIDGYTNVSSPVFFEYKDSISFMPPTGEYLFYIFPMKFFGLSISNIIFYSRFIHPAILFILVYYLLFSLLNRQDTIAKISAISGALLVTVGYDVSDYKSFINYLLHGEFISSGFLWDRLVNPITGALLLFLLLILLNRITSKDKKNISTFLASLTLSCMIGYIFSFAMGFGIALLLSAVYFYKKEFNIAGRLLVVPVSATLINLIYFYEVFSTMSGRVSLSDPRKNGLFYTHEPLLNLISIATLLFIIVCFLFFYKKDTYSKDKSWWLFGSVIVASCVLVYNQQIITGRAVWPQHFVQYTIPLCILIGTVYLHNIFRFRAKFLLATAIVLMLILSAVSAYRIINSANYTLPNYLELQSFSGVIDYLNQNAGKDCVVYVVSKYDSDINRFIPGLTSCNVYHSFNIYGGVPEDRVMHNLIVDLRIKGIKKQDINEHFSDNFVYMRKYFFRDWNDLYYLPDKWLKRVGDKEEIDHYFDTMESKIEDEYAQSLTNSLYSDLSKYRLDYFVVDKELQPEFSKNKYPFLLLEKDLGRYVIYRFVKRDK